MTNEYRLVELIMLPLDHKDDQGDLILPDDFNEEWKEILLLLSRSEFSRSEFSRSDSN